MATRSSANERACWIWLNSRWSKEVKEHMQRNGEEEEEEEERKRRAAAEGFNEKPKSVLDML